VSFPDWILANGDSLVFGLFFGLLAVLALLEIWYPGRPAPRRRERWPANFGLTVLNVVVLSFQPISLLAAAYWAEVHHVGLLHLLALPAWLVVVATLLLRAFISFATHWLMHKVPIFWRLHRVHHLDTELDVSSTVRFHPLEFLAGTLPGAPMVMAFGLSPWVLMVYEVLDAAVTIFSHANLCLPWRLERLLRYAVVTPDLHRVHHSSLQPETDSNFGAVFPVWDLVFGTFRVRAREDQGTMRLGLDEVRDRRANGLLWLLVSPLRTLGPHTGPAR
jgi:sterol desaturase/sphingolipid hydroxylase (fatty acid hydroxylase superfamily)